MYFETCDPWSSNVAVIGSRHNLLWSCDKTRVELHLLVEGDGSEELKFSTFLLHFF